MRPIIHVLVLLAACGGSDVEPDVPDDPVDIETASEPEPEVTVFDGLEKGRVVLMTLGPPGSGIPGLPGVDPALVQQALDMMIKQGVLPQGMLPPLVGSAQLRGRWTVLREQVVEEATTRERIVALLRDPNSFLAAPDCFEGDRAIRAERSEGEPLDVVVDSRCKTVDSHGIFWPHEHRGLSDGAHAELAAIFDQAFGPPPP